MNHELRSAIETMLPANLGRETVAIEINDVTITISGANAGQPPNASTRVTLSTRDGDEELINGSELGDWRDLADRVATMGEEWREAVRLAMGQLLRLHKKSEAAANRLSEARTQRDTMLREVAALGVTSYRIAKDLGVAESTVGRIIHPRDRDGERRRRRPIARPGPAVNGH